MLEVSLTAAALRPHCTAASLRPHSMLKVSMHFNLTAPSLQLHCALTACWNFYSQQLHCAFTALQVHCTLTPCWIDKHLPCHVLHVEKVIFACAAVPHARAHTQVAKLQVGKAPDARSFPARSLCNQILLLPGSLQSDPSASWSLCMPEPSASWSLCNQIPLLTGPSAYQNLLLTDRQARGDAPVHWQPLQARPPLQHWRGTAQVSLWTGPKGTHAVPRTHGALSARRAAGRKQRQQVQPAAAPVPHIRCLGTSGATDHAREPAHSVPAAAPAAAVQLLRAGRFALGGGDSGVQCKAQLAAVAHWQPGTHHLKTQAQVNWKSGVQLIASRKSFAVNLKDVSIILPMGSYMCAHPAQLCLTLGWED
eukprot:1153869-Pelagomonas_calceolata.AAC.1